MLACLHAAQYPRNVYSCQPGIGGSGQRAVFAIPFRVDLATRLRAALELSGKTQAQLARELDLPPARLGNYFTGHRTPDRAVLTRIAAAIGADVDQLTGEALGITTMLEGVLATLLRLDGVSDRRAIVIAQAAVEALRLLKALPDEGDPALRSRMAAQAAWQTRTAPTP